MAIAERLIASEAVKASPVSQFGPLEQLTRLPAELRAEVWDIICAVRSLVKIPVDGNGRVNGVNIGQEIAALNLRKAAILRGEVKVVTDPVPES